MNCFSSYVNKKRPNLMLSAVQEKKDFLEMWHATQEKVLDRE